ncbi:MFS transporter [Peribacillus sp. SCS-37]|uniref:MFS transporter n=1 Tax=Paraperibacillus esterisolvens TaxID=3115296 RepID=UPI00390613A9
MKQELFDKSQFKTLNGTMEVQGQLSSMLAGAIASILLLEWELHYILLLDVCTYGAAICTYVRLPYERIRLAKASGRKGIKISEGLTFMLGRPAMFLFLLASLIPFIGVMLTNYLFPVYLADVLKAGGNVYGIQGMIYGLGAFAGF